MIFVDEEFSGMSCQQYYIEDKWVDFMWPIN